MFALTNHDSKLRNEMSFHLETAQFIRHGRIKMMMKMETMTLLVGMMMVLKMMLMMTMLRMEEDDDDEDDAEKMMSGGR